MSPAEAFRAKWSAQRKDDREAGVRYITVRGSLEEMAAMRCAFIRQRRAFPWTVDGVHGRHPYQTARARAMAPVRLPPDHHADPLFGQATKDAAAAIQSFKPINHLFDMMLGKAA